MQSLFPLIIIGVLIYLVFFRKGGMGCCGGHLNHEEEKGHKIDSKSPFYKTGGKVIDLDKDEYKIQR